MLSQTASDAVIVSLRRSLSWANIVTWPVRLTARLVRIEGVRAARATCQRLFRLRARSTRECQAAPRHAEGRSQCAAHGAACNGFPWC